MTPVHHKGAIQLLISSANGVSSKEYYRGHQILSVGHISSISITICNFSENANLHIIVLHIFRNNSKREGFRG